MKERLAFAGLFLSFLVSPCPASGQAHFTAREHQTEYNGPGREDRAPEGLTSVNIGYFGPSDPEHPDGGDLWLAATMAIEEANQEGGYQGIPFHLVPAWTENPWGTGIAQVVRMVYLQDVWAIIGSIDGASTHLVEQVAAKARVTVINPASTDNTVHLANVPWMFSCLPGDHRLAPVLARGLLARVGEGTVTLVSSTDHDARVFSEELETALARRGGGFDFHLQVDERVHDFTSIARRIVGFQSRAVVIAAGPQAGARLLLSLREEAFRGMIFGGPSMARRAFVETVGSSGEGAVFPLLSSLSASERFVDRFSLRFGRVPDYACIHTYDAARLLIQAVRTAGLNRARIRDAVAAASPWKGVGGVVTWDPLGQNERPVQLGTLEEGRVVALAP